MLKTTEERFFVDSLGVDRQLIRCPWANRDPELTYHDEEWGVPEHGDYRLFESLTLEGRD